jgi:hypothetical protein
MGLFLETVIIPGCKEAEARSIVKAVEEAYSNQENDEAAYQITELYADQCQYREYANGVSILINEECIGYDDLAEAISSDYGKVVMLLYIYDGDFWAYALFDNGELVDKFNPQPDYFEEVSEEVIEASKGNADVIAKYFHVERADIEKYLVRWKDDLGDMEDTAYDDDEFGYGEWQMADFMRKLGYPYEFEEA